MNIVYIIISESISSTHGYMVLSVHKNLTFYPDPTPDRTANSSTTGAGLMEHPPFSSMNLPAKNSAMSSGMFHLLFVLNQINYSVSTCIDYIKSTMNSMNPPFFYISVGQC